MSCREDEADIVDLARGAGVSVEAEARLRAHLDACAGCAARFAREQQLTAALEEVADAAPQPSRSDGHRGTAAQGVCRAQHAAGSREAASPRRPWARWRRGDGWPRPRFWFSRSWCGAGPPRGERRTRPGRRRLRWRPSPPRRWLRLPRPQRPRRDATRRPSRRCSRNVVAAGRACPGTARRGARPAGRTGRR